MSEIKAGQFESQFSRDYHGDRAQERYERIRMAVFSPDYLLSHRNWDDEDFTKLLDCVMALLECPNRLAALLSASGNYQKIAYCPDAHEEAKLLKAMSNAQRSLNLDALKAIFIKIGEVQERAFADETTPGPSPANT